MKKKIILSAVCCIAYLLNSSFCGFYVSKADGTLKNKTSQVILARDGDHTVITMYNDFKGKMEDFAMVVPVPVILQKKDVKVVSNEIFKKLNDYSAPRLVEYYDENPCAVRVFDEVVVSGLAAVGANAPMDMKSRRLEKNKVTIEAQYSVGEYDILILSAKESSGLKSWLTENGYKIPKDAEEVLDPYIKSNLKFFVVKVNIEEQKKMNSQFLRPLQIQFSSPKFMLPIRLGMANADGDQDMIVYAFTKNGRVETTNYRSISMPTAKNIPLFVQPGFARFYGDLFENFWNKEGKNASFVEYAWDVSPANSVKCDPCVSTPPDNEDLAQAGVWWIKNNKYEDYVNEYEKEKDQVFFTRLHIRYNRKSFPQDIMFQSTPNTEQFQARYIITHPATGDLSCAGGKKYLKELKERRIKEMEMLSYLTGKDMGEWKDEASAWKDEQNQQEVQYASIIAGAENESNDKSKLPAALVICGAVMLCGTGVWRVIRA